MCTFCNEHSETIQHLFWSCQIVKTFWDRLGEAISNKCQHANRMVFKEKLVLFGLDEFMYTDSVCDLIILMAKLYIYKCKVQNITLNLQNFLKELYFRFCLEKIIIKDQMTFNNKWGPYDKLFKSLLWTIKKK